MKQASFFDDDGDDRPPYGDSLSRAHEYVFAEERFRKATAKHNACPCCGQNVKLRKRRLNAKMVQVVGWMVAMFRENGGDWIHLPSVAPRFVIRSREHGRLHTCWGLIEPMPNLDDPTKKCSGSWRPTQKGIDFIRGLPSADVPPYALTFDHKCYGMRGEPKSARQLLEGSGFDYRELMSLNAF